MKRNDASPPKEFMLDDARKERIGLDEAIYCQGKSPAQTDSIVASSIRNRTPRLLTRLDRKAFEALDADHRERLDYDPVSRTAILAFDRESDSAGGFASMNEAVRVTVASAGTSDVPAAKEAVRTLAYYKEAAQEIHDIGVAGLWRLLDRLDDIRSTPVVIAAAGMEASLPSVLGGQVAGLVIALPTSNGAVQLRTGAGGGQYRQRLRRRLPGFEGFEDRRALGGFSILRAHLADDPRRHSGAGEIKRERKKSSSGGNDAPGFEASIQAREKPFFDRKRDLAILDISKTIDKGIDARRIL